MKENEVWVITPLPSYNASWAKILCINCNGPMIIKCYQKSTKEFIHEYGPFDTPEELTDFAKTHGVKLAGLT